MFSSVKSMRRLERPLSIHSSGTWLNEAMDKSKSLFLPEAYEKSQDQEQNLKI